MIAITLDDVVGIWAMMILTVCVLILAAMVFAVVFEEWRDRR